MAKRKETIWQRDFWLGSIRPEAIERDDSPVVTSSLKTATNTISLSTGQCEVRPGTMHRGDEDGEHGFEVVLGDASTFELVIRDGGLSLYTDDGTEEHSETITWEGVSDVYGSPAYADLDFWVLGDPDTATIIIGTQYFAPRALTFDGASWSLGLYEVAETATGAKKLPFWRHYPTITVQPSARTGTITLTASAALWTTKHEGAFVRYNGRQIELTTRSSATVMNGTVKEELPPTLDITVASASGFQVDDAVEAETSGGQGVITGIAGSVITVLVTTNFSGFNTGEDLIGPNAKSNMSVVATASSLADTFLWDMQMWNQATGYPGEAARHGGRLYLANFPELPSAFTSSAANNITDFEVGTDDGDAFAESLGAGSGGHLKHIISAEDLLFFTTRGLYYQPTREGTPVTPLTIAPRRFSNFGCNNVKPVAVDDGAVFVDPSGKQIHAAVLAGDIYQAWRVEQISKYASHVIGTPVRLGATESGSEKPELLVIATNSDGSLAVCQWDRAENRVSWRPWTTDGEFVNVYQAFGKIHAIVDRTINSVDVRFRERFETGCYVDCAAIANIGASYPTGLAGVAVFDSVTKLATHLNGHTASIYFENFDMGDREISSGLPLDDDGNNLAYPDGNLGFAQVGLHFDMQIIPWSRRSVNTQEGTREVKRLIQMYLTVQDTGVFEVNGRPFGDYDVGDDLTMPPALRDMQISMAFLGRTGFEEIQVTRPRPGPFRLLKIGYRVVI